MSDLATAKARLLQLGEQWDAERRQAGPWGSPLLKAAIGVGGIGLLGSMFIARRASPFRLGTILFLLRIAVPAIVSELAKHKGARRSVTR